MGGQVTSMSVYDKTCILRLKRACMLNINRRTVNDRGKMFFGAGKNLAWIIASARNGVVVVLD